MRILSIVPDIFSYNSLICDFLKITQITYNNYMHVILTKNNKKFLVKILHLLNI